jgi:hypothetical protein
MVSQSVVLDMNLLVLVQTSKSETLSVALQQYHQVIPMQAKI